MPAQFGGVPIGGMQYNGLDIVEAMMDGEIVWRRDSTLDMSFLNYAVVQPMNIVFAGSSTTQGYGVPRYENYSHTMVARIARHEPDAWATTMKYYDNGIGQPTGNGFNFANVGLGGTTSANYLHGARRSATNSFGPHLIIHMIGSNDYAQQMPLETYKANLREVIGSFPAFTRHLLVHSFRRRDRANTGITWAQYGEALKEVAREFDNAAMVDVSEAWEDRQMPSVPYLMGDNIHATWQGNELLAHTVADAMGLQYQYGETIWAVEASSPNFTSGSLVPSSDSRVQLAATSPSSGSRVTKVTSGGVSLINFSSSGARYADTPSWNQAVAFPLAFFAVIHDWGDGSFETNTAPFFSRSIANDDGWWWVWRMKNTAEYRAALNSAFSDPAIRSSTSPWIIGVHMTSNNRATVFINSLDPVAVLGPVSVDAALGPWMKSLRLGANSSLGSYTAMRAREIRFTSAPIRPSGFMSDQMRALGIKYGRVLDELPTLQGFQVGSTTDRVISQNVWTTVESQTIQGDGNGELFASWSWKGDGLMWLSHTRRVRITVNGVTLFERSASSTTGEWSSSYGQVASLSGGDVVRMQVHANGSSNAVRTLMSRNFSLTPQLTPAN